MATKTIRVRRGTKANLPSGGTMAYEFRYCTDTKELYLDTDEGNLLINAVVGALNWKGSIDCTLNPNYPAATLGDTYFVSVAGKIGGASGEDVTVGDMLICNTTAVAGDHATVGSYWDIIDDPFSVYDYLLISDIDDTPVNGEVDAPISSNWAYDHTAAADPHTGYRLESADHTHETTGAQGGQLDHGLSMTAASLLDNDHPQYLLLTDIDDTPVNAETAQPISSNWAYDHAADNTAHGLDITAPGLEDTPVDGHTALGITSNWAYDHAADTDAHGDYALKTGDTFTGDVAIGTTTAGKNLSVVATEGAEMSPALEGANWTCGTDGTGGWTANAGTLVKTASAGTQTATPSGTFTVTAGRTYKVVIVVSAAANSPYYSIGGVQGTILTATTLTEYITAISTGKIIFGGGTTATCTITSLSVKEVTSATGDATINGALYARGGIVLPLSGSYPSLNLGRSRTGFGAVDFYNYISWANNGTMGGILKPGSIVLQNQAAGFIGFSAGGDSNGDVMLGRDGAAATLFLRNSTTQNILRIYNTYTNTSNYERLSLTGVAGASVNITAETAGTGGDNLDIVLTPAGTGTVKIVTGLNPNASDGAALGTTSLMWSDLCLANGAVINYNNGNVTLTHSAGVLTLGVGTLKITTPTITDDSVVTVDSADAADNEYARFTANGIEGRTASETYTDLLAQTMLENDALILDAALSADGKYNGIVRAGTAGATLAFGDVCYLAVADSRWELADADAAATAQGLLGICVLAAADDAAATKMLLWGIVRADTAFPSFTVGAPVYLSATDGDLTSTAPSGNGDIIRCVGQAWTADELFFNPSADFFEYTA